MSLPPYFTDAVHVKSSGVSTSPVVVFVFCFMRKVMSKWEYFGMHWSFLCIDMLSC